MKCKRKIARKGGHKYIYTYRPIDVIKLMHIKNVRWSDIKRMKNDFYKEYKDLEFELQEINEAIALKSSILSKMSEPKKPSAIKVPAVLFPYGKWLSPSEILSAASNAPKSLSGVYFLINNEEVVYVGMSLNMFNRVQEHIKNSEKLFNKVTFFDTHRVARSAVESYYISPLNPRLNRASGMGLRRILEPQAVGGSA